MSYTDSGHMGVQHNEWLKTLDFYKDELDVLEKRLEEVAVKNTSSEAGVGTEHFQNQFIIQRNNIMELKHTISLHSHRVFEDVKNHAGKVEKALVDEHMEIGDNLEQFEKIFRDLRIEFNLYVTKWI